jgi:NAD(P)-dependent dehydrogenase (short-subunit alcohol dehydrogenase family)
LERLFSLKGKVVLVTGAGGGIGSVLALGMAQAGASIGLHDLSEVRLEGACAAIERAGGAGVAFAADLRHLPSCQTLIDSVYRRFGRLDVLVNCAGTNRREPMAAVTPEDFEEIVAVNLRSLFFLSQAAHPILRAQGSGKIINVGSLTSFIGLGTVSVYGLTKAAVAQLTKTMAVEWAKDNIQVNCLAPGFMLTPLTEQSLWAHSDKREWLLGRIPMRRPGQPSELVGAALLLASDASAYLTGQTIVVDGGVLAGGSWDTDPADDQPLCARGQVRE